MRRAPSTVQISRRYCGPPGYGNGGYAAGLFGAPLGPSAEVTLSRPIPLEAPLTRTWVDEGLSVEGADGQEIARVRATTLACVPREVVSFEEAHAARARFLGLQGHMFPGCFVCGTERTEGDGMRLFAGEVSPGVVASSWVLAPGLATGGQAPNEIVTAALDCPGAWAVLSQAGRTMPILLGRIAYRLRASPKVHERCTVMGWARRVEGRKYYCDTAIVGEQGDLLACATATWIAPRLEPPDETHAASP